MTLIKKFAWYGSSVSLAALLAIVLLAGAPMKTAQAAWGAPTFTAPVQAAGLTETWTVGVTTAGGAAIPAGSTISVVFPSSFSVTGVAASDVTLGGAMFAGVTVASVNVTTAGQVIITTAGAATTPGVGTITVADIVNGSAQTYTASTTQSSTAGFYVVASAGETTAVAAAAAPVIWNVSITASPSSIPADGVSTTAINITPSATAGNTGGGVVTVQTTNGTFVSIPAANEGDLFEETPAGVTIATNGLTVSDTVDNAVSNAADTVYLQAPTSAGSATITVRVTPASGGTSVLLGQATVTFTSPAALPTLTTINVTPTTTQSVAAAGGAGNGQAYTITLLDQNGATLAGGTTVTVTTSGNAVVDSNATTCNLGANNTGAAVNSDVDCTFSSTGGADVVEVYGINAPGTATVTVKATPSGSTTPIEVTRTLTLTGGTVSSIDLKVYQSSPTATSATAGSIIADRDNTTNGTDELIAVATMLDVNGNPITPSGVATFKITDANGNAVNNLLGTGGEAVAPQAGAACDGAVNNTLGTCTDNVQANAALGKPGAVAILDNDRSSTSALAAGTYTLTVTWGSGSSQKSATATFTVGGPAATVTISGDTNVAVNGSGTVTATVLDANGNPVADGTTVNFASSSAVILLQTTGGTTGTNNVAVTTTGGQATITLLGLAQGQSQIIASAGNKNGTQLVTVGSATTPPPAGDGGFTGPIADSGVSPVNYGGGTVADLKSAAMDAGAVSVTIYVDGVRYSMVVNAPDFANATFNSQFADGVPAVIVLLVK